MCVPRVIIVLRVARRRCLVLRARTPRLVDCRRRASVHCARRAFIVPERQRCWRFDCVVRDISVLLARSILRILPIWCVLGALGARWAASSLRYARRVRTKTTWVNLCARHVRAALCASATRLTRRHVLRAVIVWRVLASARSSCVLMVHTLLRAI